MFKEAARQNTGKLMCDSGDYYGRHYDKPPVTDNDPVVQLDKDYLYPTIETALFLEKWCGGVDEDLQSQWEKWDEENGQDLSYFESGSKFCEEVLDLIQYARDNTCNGESDLSQDYVWEVWGKENIGDWIYPDDDTVSVFYIHTGCDVRSGYSKPLFVRPSNCSDDYSVPMDVVAGWYPIEARDSDGNEVDHMDIWEAIDGIDSVGIGYCSNPSYHLFENYAKRVFKFTATKDTICILTEDGYKVKLGLEVRCDY